MRILISGYAGFIGSNLTRYLYKTLGKKDEIFGIDAYTYAARPEWVFKGIPASDRRFKAMRVDIRDFNTLLVAVKHFKPDQVYHLAAESHVCRSIEGPRAFVETNVVGTFNMIEALRQTGFKGRFLHVSTDEAFGELDSIVGRFNETTPINPTSPYSSTKASSDLIVKSYHHTYGMDSVVTRCTNNYGPNQHPEKLISKTINCLLNDEVMTVYGKGTNIRDWIYVDDHCEALKTVMMRGRSGEVYCIGSGLELRNIDVINEIEKVMKKTVKLKYTDDRSTDDLRYAVSTNKIEGLIWSPNSSPVYFRKMIERTVDWYKELNKNTPKETKRKNSVKV